MKFYLSTQHKLNHAVRLQEAHAQASAIQKNDNSEVFLINSMCTGGFWLETPHIF